MQGQLTEVPGFRIVNTKRYLLFEFFYDSKLDDFLLTKLYENQTKYLGSVGINLANFKYTGKLQLPFYFGMSTKKFSWNNGYTKFDLQNLPF